MNKEKEKLNELKKQILITSVATVMCVAYCTKSYTKIRENEEILRKRPAIEKLYEDNYNVNKSSKLKLLKIKDSNDIETYHIVKELTNRELYLLDEKYDIYDPKKHSSYTYYVDIFTTELVSIKGYKTNLINEIVEEEPLINYTSKYYGKKKTYSIEELESILEDLNNNKVSKIK